MEAMILCSKQYVGSECADLMIRILDSEYGVSGKSTDAMLFDKNDGKALRMECSFAQLNISDGARLLLI